MLAGLGAPAGALLLRLASTDIVTLDDLLAHRFFYLYMAIGTPVAFAAFGVALGRLLDTSQQSRETYRKLSNTDELTGIANRRAFDDAFAREVARSRRSGVPVGCLVLDIDRFKVFNDAYGHEAGDEVLRAVGRVLVRTARAADVPARIGGDEFAVLAPGASPEDTEVLARRIERELAAESVRATSTVPLHPTVTIGIAVAAGADVAELIRRADRALLQGKRSHPSGR
jgi:diguanylate cyclase (GGDEF)-like protein